MDATNKWGSAQVKAALEVKGRTGNLAEAAKGLRGAAWRGDRSAKRKAGRNEALLTDVWARLGLGTGLDSATEVPHTANAVKAKLASLVAFGEP